ncbi:MAG: TetR/AcrR family transcriptional regulator [Rhodopseudomonas sp.]|uniref:TetR/AcrR family transcriptional regulator n=1 Tax=Rhodopseudomonas sp. TaxID=1078 RepID=UPI0017C2F275|nr:TetR/AcrR family transcriptional regulator [Rhodopseudomonas sp.]NVN84715.1 TetR/AcrR family transcriptional regulator [Rhodopseudomonas sp.]
MRRRPDVQPAVATRDRILNAAVLRFSRHSYEATGLRDIAADVGVDVAYVHRCFGSKERLFAEAVGAAMEPALLLNGPADELAGALAKQIFAHDAARGRDEVGPLDIVIRSLSSPEASRVLTEFIVKDFIQPLAGKLDQPAAARAAVIAAFLAGLGILRNVLRISPLQEAEGGDVEHLIASAIGQMINAGVGVRPA